MNLVIDTAILAKAQAGVPLSEKEAAIFLGVGWQTVRRLIDSGRLAAVDLGTASHRNYRIHPMDLSKIGPVAGVTPPSSRSRRRQGNQRRFASVAKWPGLF